MVSAGRQSTTHALASLRSTTWQPGGQELAPVLPAFMHRTPPSATMEILVSIAARDRQFGRQIRRVRPALDPLLEELASVVLVDPIHEAILIGLTDATPAGSVDIIPNRDGYFQVIAGLPAGGSDEDRLVQVVAAMKQAVAACPFSDPDRLSLLALLESWTV